VVARDGDERLQRLVEQLRRCLSRRDVGDGAHARRPTVGQKRNVQNARGVEPDGIGIADANGHEAIESPDVADVGALERRLELASHVVRCRAEPRSRIPRYREMKLGNFALVTAVHIDQPAHAAQPRS